MKKMTMKLLSILLVLGLTLSLAACGGSGSAAGDIVHGDFEEVSEGQWVGRSSGGFQGSADRFSRHHSRGPRR